LALGLAASRRTILVVSQSFIESEWTRPEVRIALTGFLRKPRNRLLAVILSPWTDDQSDPELSLLLRSAVTIKWGDRYFYDTLRYYLPDPTPSHYIRNLQGGGLWYQTGGSTHSDPSIKRTLPHPLPADADHQLKKTCKSELYWDAQNPGSALPRRYTSTPHGSYCPRSDQQYHHHHPDDASDYSGGQSYSRLEHSYMSIDHGHEHIYSCVQDPAEYHQHHHQQQPQQQQQQHPQNCWSYRYPAEHTVHHHQQHLQFGPRPPAQQPPPVFEQKFV